MRLIFLKLVDNAPFSIIFLNTSKCKRGNNDEVNCSANQSKANSSFMFKNKLPNSGQECQNQILITRE